MLKKVPARREREEFLFKIKMPSRRLQELRRRLIILHRETFHPLLHHS
jgi:hypothetical protein